jgi:hypothetical protein
MLKESKTYPDGIVRRDAMLRVSPRRRIYGPARRDARPCVSHPWLVVALLNFRRKKD